MAAIRTYREEGIAVVCPTCGAMALEPCTGDSGHPRKSLHSARHELAVELGAPRVRSWEERQARGRRSLERTHGQPGADGRTAAPRRD